MKRNRVLYSLLSIGVIGAFFGHGMFAATLTNDKFLTLFSGSFDNVLGVTVSESTTETWVRIIGFADLGVVSALVVMLAGVLLGRGALYRLAYSPFALALYSWGAFWGFVTAVARVTGAGQFYPEIWDIVERTPNFMLPAAVVYLIYQHRQDHGVVASTREFASSVH